MDEKMEDDDFGAQPLFAAALALPDATRNSFYFARTSDQLSKRLQDENTTAASSELPLGWEEAEGKGTVQHIDLLARESGVRARTRETGDILSRAGSPRSKRRRSFDVERPPVEPPAPTSCMPIRLLKKFASFSQGGKIGAWASTAIAGNDCTSSVLYTSGLCVSNCGSLSPVALLLVSVPLFFYRYIYSEVVTALPLNGGVYNVMLNVSSKRTAAMVSVLIILSYIATAVVSADSAASYMHALVGSCPKFWFTFAILVAFAVLSIFGVKDTAPVAMAIFFHHLITMIVLCGFSFAHLIKKWPALLVDNWNVGPYSSSGYGADIWLLTSFIVVSNSIFRYGYSSALLGVTGFESAANFVESQVPGSFPKVLRNIWFILLFQNVIVEFLLIATVPVSDVSDNIANALILMADQAHGGWLTTWVGVDAVVVLSGAVFTSFVGILGLVERLSRDRCMPQFLLQKNRCFKTMHWIIICFLALTSSLYAVTRGSTTALSGVYTVAFLSVLIVVGIGNLLLKYTRGKLPTLVRAPVIFILAAIVCMAIGLAGNVLFLVRNS